MQKQLPLIFAVLLLITVTACGGAKSESDGSADLGQPTKGLDDSPVQSKGPIENSATPKLEKKATTRQSEPGTKEPDSRQSAVPDPSPKLSTEEEKVVSQITKEVKTKGDFETQNSGMTTVNRVLIAQQAMWLISGSFSPDFKALEPNLPMETDEYRFDISRGDQSEAVVVAIAKSDKLPSFTGKAVAIPTKTPKIGLCQTKLPSQTPPMPPKIDQSQVICGNDGVLVKAAQP